MANSVGFSGIIAAVLTVLLIGLVAPVQGQEKGKTKIKVLNVSQVYYPSRVKKSAKYKKPAVLTTATVFAAIPEWKQIKEKKLTNSSAEYHLLLKKANEKFNKALGKVQGVSSYDIMAEVGAIQCTNCTATDVTATIIANLGA
ncbi:MAG: hypothetical protein ACI97A_001826 [Planctomycetota bacterium]|jgi:hypothetical protein